LLPLGKRADADQYNPQVVYPPGAEKGVAVERSLARYLRHHRAEGASPHTLKFHKEGAGGYVAWLKATGRSVDLADVDADTAREWIEDMRDRGLAQATANRRVRSLKALTRWAAEEEWLDKDPLRKLKPPKVDDNPKPTLCPEEVERLLATCDRKTVTGARDFAILLLLFSTGLRATELTGLRAGDVDWDRGLVAVRHGKGGKYRVVPLGGKAERGLDKYLDHPMRRKQAGDSLFLTDEGEPMGYVALRQMLERRGARAGVHANAHKWRHSAAITYLRQGGRIETLKAMLGHSTIDMTLHYARIAGVDLTTAHETADPTRSLRTRV
jgi:site-specific recombinase XerD